MTSKTYSVPDISCSHCTATIERELQLIEGLESVRAELESKQVTVEVQREDVLAEVEKMLEEIGYPAA
jgi:copper chaperone